MILSDAWWFDLSLYIAIASVRLALLKTTAPTIVRSRSDSQVLATFSDRALSEYHAMLNAVIVINKRNVDSWIFMWALGLCRDN